MTGHFSVQIHPSTILLGHFSVQIHPSTIFLFFTTLGALSFDRHKTSLECTRSSQDGAGQYAGDRGRIEQRAVRCSTRPSAGSLQPGNRSIGPARTARCSTPGSSQDGAVQHTGLPQTERKRAMVSAHARAHTRTAGTTGIPWMFCMFCMHCSTRPSAGTFQPRNSARAHQHGHIYTHARAHTHTTGTTGLTQ